MNYLNKKHLLMAALAGGTVVVASGVAVYVDNQAVAAVITADSPLTNGTGGIGTTRHNLSSSGWFFNHAETGATGADSQICVFCHTPHGADLETDAPLWNRNVDPTREYATYTSLGRSSFDGRNSLSATSVGAGVSLACLSCHDGVQAMNAVINSPGPGTSDPLNADPATDPASMTAFTGVWTGATNLTGNDYGYTADTNLFGAIGTDLRNDHPIGMQYAGGFDGTDAATYADPDFVQPTADGDYWFIDVPVAGNPLGTEGARDKGDMQLYSRTDGAYVECASCHDPHVSDTLTFLRISNENSNVCLSCHNK